METFFAKLFLRSLFSERIFLPKTGRVYSEEEIEENVQLLVDEFLTSNDTQEAINCLKELKASEKDALVAQKIVLDAFEKKDPVREKMIDLLVLFATSKEISAETLTETFQQVLGDIEDFAIDIPFSPMCIRNPKKKPFFFNVGAENSKLRILIIIISLERFLVVWSCFWMI